MYVSGVIAVCSELRLLFCFVFLPPRKLNILLQTFTEEQVWIIFRLLKRNRSVYQMWSDKYWNVTRCVCSWKKWVGRGGGSGGVAFLLFWSSFWQFYFPLDNKKKSVLYLHRLFLKCLKKKKKKRARDTVVPELFSWFSSFLNPWLCLALTKLNGLAHHTHLDFAARHLLGICFHVLKKWKWKLCAEIVALK